MNRNLKNSPVSIITDVRYESIANTIWSAIGITPANLKKALLTIQKTYDLDIELREERWTIKEKKGITNSESQLATFNAMLEISKKNRITREAALLYVKKVKQAVTTILTLKERMKLSQHTTFTETMQIQLDGYCRVYKIEDPDELIKAWNSMKDEVYTPIQKQIAELKADLKEKAKQTKYDKQLSAKYKDRLNEIKHQELIAQDTLILETEKQIAKQVKKEVKKEMKEINKTYDASELEGAIETQIDF